MIGWRRRFSERGSAVALALMLLLVLALALAVLSEGIVARMREEQREAQSVRLSAACDAALAESLAGLAASSDFPGFAAQRFGDGTIESEIQADGTIRFVRARGTLGGRIREIEAEIRFREGRPYVVQWRRML